MKQFTIFNQLTAMPKRLAMVLTVLFTLGVGSMLGAALGDGYEKVTDISTLSAGDRVVLYCDDNSVGVTGWNNNKDATVATTGWVEYLVEAASGGVYLKDENVSKYIASPGSSNQFLYGTKAVCTVDANGVLKCNSRLLYANGTNYRMYSNIQSAYKAFYVYKVLAATPYTVKFYKTSTTFESVTEKSAGEGVNPPTMEKVCGEWEFQGWSESSSNSENSTTPLSVVTLTNKKYYPTKDIDLYPVYTKSEGGGGTAYTKVTTISEGVYVMVSEKTSGTYKYMPNTISSGANPNLGSGITISTTSGITSLTNEVTDAMLWDFTSTGTANQFYLRPHGSTTVGLGCTASTGANIRISSTYKDVKWTITTSSSYGWQFKSNASSAMYLAVYSDSNWRNYTSSTTNQNGKFHLFKQTSSSTTYYYSYPQCATQSTVTLSKQGGSGGTSSVTATYEQPMPTITPPTRAGYDFQGYYDGTSIQYYNANGTSAKDWDKEDATFTLYAQWTAKTYTVTLNNQGATTAGATSVTATYNAAMPSIASNLPQKTGYTFNGYFDADSGGTKYYNANGTSAKNWDKEAATTTLYAQWTCETPVFDIKIKDDNPVVFSGEPIELTVVGSNIATDATYQWYKGNEEIANQNSATLTIEDWDANDIGNYACEVSNGTCSKINNYTVKMYSLRGLIDWETDCIFERATATTATYSTELYANASYEFKIFDGSDYYGNTGDDPTMTHINCTNWTMQQNMGNNVTLKTTASGTYIFTIDFTDQSNPTISVTYPQKKMVYFNPGNWNCPKYAVYSWEGDNKSTVLMTKIDDCADRNIYQAEIDASHSNVIFIGGTASYNVANTWNNVSYQTIDLTYPSDDNVLYEINTTHLFLVPNSNWKEIPARFAAYFFGNGETWVSMTKVTENLYKVTIPTAKTYPSVIFCRMNPSAAANNWNNKWNQSADLTIIKGKNHYTIEEGTWDKGGGTWKTAGDWTAFTPNYTVTFDANGHGTAPDAQCVAENGKATTPAAPTATGYTFGGWYTDQACNTAWDFANDVVTADITLYAKWTINTHTVTWIPAGGNWGGDANNKVQTYKFGELIEAPDKPIYGCHEFVEWDPAYTVGETTMPDDDLEFTAQWNKLSYTITFKNYDGTVLQTSTVECGETPSYTGATPTREQTAQYTYTFKGWSPTIASVTQDQVYTAQFTQTTRSYTVIWYDGTGNAHKTQSANYNATISVPTTDPDPCDAAYPHFIGWTADPIVGSTTTQPELVENVKVTGDCDYYAVFAKGKAGENGSYTLDYEEEGLKNSNKWGSYGTAYEHTAKDGSTWVIKAYKNAGMQINKDKNASIKIPACPSPITSIEVTGTTSKAVGLSASDYTGSGTITYIASGTDATNQTLDLSEKSVTGGYIVAKSGNIPITKIIVNFGAQTEYTAFITTCCTSWTAPTLTYPTELEENGTATPQLGAGTTHGTVTYASSNPSILSVNSTTGEISAQAPGTATVTATWSGDGTYCSVSSTSNVITVKGSFSVIFKANGGTETMANQKADENNKIAQLNANQFTRTGYAFVGWNTSSYGTGTAYTDQQTNITLAQNLTLYAQWAPVVTLNDAGNEETTHPTAVNGTITLPDGANACKPYEFVGWTAVATGDWNEGIKEPALVASPYKPTQPTTLYAVYKIQSEGNANAFKLSFEGGNGKTYYVGSYNSSPYLRGYSNITKEEAVTFIRTKMYPDNDTKYYIYMEHKSEYLYYNGTFNSTSSTPDENQGWVFHTVGDKIKLQSTYSYDPEYLSFSDRDQETINMGTNASGSEFNMLSAVTSTYVASPLCNQEIEIIFETGNGDFVDNAPATNPLTVSRGDVITLPTCEYPGYEFMGWLKDEQQLDPSDIIGTYYTGDYTVDGVSSTITFYAYYKVIPEEVEFTGKDDVELLMYYYDGTENYYYSVSHGAERGELSSKQNCFNATTWTFTNVGNMQYHIQDETGKYLGAYSDGDNDLILSATPKVWTFTEVNGLWKMVCENSPSRALMYISTGKTFANSAITNEGNGAYSYVTLGICPYPTYTTNPVLSQGFSITNTAMVTSASGQKVKATSALTLETRNIELPCTFTISAPNITFYDNTGAEVTQLTSSAASEQFELHFAYKPTAENTIEYPTVTITDDEMKTSTIKNRIYARSLPATFAIVAKVGNLWYALPSQGLNSTTPPAAYPIEVDDMADPTAVTAVPANADWSLRQVYEASRVDATKDRFVANGENFVFVNNEGTPKALNASASGNYLLTDAQYSGYYETNPGLYEWTPTTSDLETYTLTNAQRTDRTLNVSINNIFGVHSDNKATTEVRFLPIQNRYTPMAAQVVEWKENSVVVMYNGDPAQTAFVTVNAGAAQETTLSSAQKDIAVYELAANGLATNPTQSLSITIGTEKAILPIPYIVSSETTDLALLPGATVAARQEVAKVADLVVLNGATLTAAGAKGNPYKFRNATIYGGGKLVIPSEKGFGVASLTLRAGGITDAGKYDYVYPQFELRGTFTNSAAKINYDYITDYDHWFHLVLPFSGDLGTIKYPTEFYGANVAANNTGSWQIKRYAGEIRATGNYDAWKDLETEGKTSTIAGQGYIFWGAPKKVSVNGGTSTRQKWGIQRITMSITAPNAMTAENGDKAISELSSYANVPNNSRKDNDQGWNLIGNPYMVNLTGLNSQSLQIGQLIHDTDASGNWTGKWEWDDTSEQTGLRYVTIPSDHFETYEAKPMTWFTESNPMIAGRSFFVQIAGAATDLVFDVTKKAALMPALLAENNDKPVDIETGIVLSNETLQDEVNFWIKDGKTNNYEYNADYPKTPNNNHFNIYGVHTNGDLSWVATSPEYAAESMPIGYQVPAAGTFTLSVSETYYSENLQALFVTDHEASPEVTTNLVDEDYTFYVNQAETNNTRFTVSIILKPDTENTPTGVDNINTKANQPIKFLYQDKIYILRNGMIYDTTGKQVITINK